MVFDVMLREGFNDAGKQKAFVYRVHGSELGAYLRDAQNQGKYIISAIPLYPVKDDRVRFVKESGIADVHVGDLIGDGVAGD